MQFYRRLPNFADRESGKLCLNIQNDGTFIDFVAHWQYRRTSIYCRLAQSKCHAAVYVCPNRRRWVHKHNGGGHYQNTLAGRTLTAAGQILGCKGHSPLLWGASKAWVNETNFRSNSLVCEVYTIANGDVRAFKEAHLRMGWNGMKFPWCAK